MKHQDLFSHRIHMKHQDLFSVKDKSKKMSSAAILFGSLRVKEADGKTNTVDLLRSSLI